MDTPWRIQLLGRLQATQADRVLSRFRARKAGVLLAYLAYHRDRPHPREELIELLWPEAEPHAGRSSLSRELTSLRRQLEPPGVPAGAVILAGRDSVQLNPAACTTDVQAFQAALEAAGRARGAAERMTSLMEAAELYQGELLPAYFDSWILPERRWLAERFLHALEQLMISLEEAGDHRGAIQWARRAVAADPLREEGHHGLIRLLHAAGQPAAALRQYHELERLLAEAPGMVLTPQIRALVREIERVLSVADPGLPFPTPAPAAVLQCECPPVAPTGTVTFLLAEVNGQEALKRGDEWFRPLLRAHHGYELQAPTGMWQAAFARPSDALSAAVTVYRHCASLPRLALHTAEVPPGKQAQHSPALHHATSVLLAVHPGQILLSEKSAILLRDELEPEVHLLDLGPYRLRGDRSPERLFQICAPDMPACDFPPPNALPAHEGNLPLQFTRFFGRQEEIARLRALLSETVDGRRQAVDDGEGDLSLPDYRLPPTAYRLLTLTGPGGSGKTRLALEVAQHLRDRFRGAVWFVPLQDLTDPRLIPDKLLDALRLPRSSQLQPVAQAIAFLGRQPSLLLLDNFEHLVDEGARVVLMLLEQVPALVCLITSRQRLHLAGEQEYPVAPLPVPPQRDEGKGMRDEKESSSASSLIPYPSSLLACPSVQLFVDRAQAVRPDFQVTRSNAAAVAALCARLEGLPLALVLAAARVGVMTPEQMLARLEQRLDLLVGRQRDSGARHRSLRAALDWSYQLLSPELQQFFSRLSVFRGGWTLAAAEAVCGHTPQSTVQSLEQLRECSLSLVAEEGGGTAERSEAVMRFRLLETLREYAAEQLGEQEREELARRHAHYYLAFAEEADHRLCGPELELWLARLKAEHDNMRAVLAWAVARQDAETALRLGGAFFNHWSIESLLAEGRYWLETSLQLPGSAARTALRALALRGLAVMRWLQGDYDAARTAAGESMAIYRELNDKVGVATALGILGWLEQQSGGDLAAMRAAREESLALFREAGDLWGTAGALHDLGRSACEEGDHETAWRLHEESEALYRLQGDPFRLSYPLLGLGHVAQRRGDYAAARHYFAESLAIRQRFLGESVAKANALSNLAEAEWCLGNWQAAMAGLEQCIELRRLGSFPQAMAWDLMNLGRMAQCAGQPDRAAEPLEESLHLFRKHGIRNGEAQALMALGRLAYEQQRAAEALPLLRDGLALAQAVLDQAAVATALEEIAALLADQRAQEELERAARLLGAGEAIRRTAAAPVPPYERVRHDQQRTALHAALGDAAFQAAWNAGQALTLHQAVAEALQQSDAGR